MSLTTGELVWEDPPAPKTPPRGDGRVSQIIHELQLHPGKWAIVARYATSNSAGSSGDKFKARGCEATIREGVLYARWPEVAS